MSKYFGKITSLVSSSWTELDASIKKIMTTTSMYTNTPHMEK